MGLVVDRPARVLGIEPYFMQLISGIQDALADGPAALLLQVTDDSAAEYLPSSPQVTTPRT
ncbi:hypothetical protein [Haloactinomyces albus]|uniref:DNA-binding LacI/PurR family transcriptional regulator n=1 Tax=Haloactinomyces albus TaxID=1352928 RepID=A0AAE3ZHG7_9ACTN|nr:hypothetical protein [Haloactinomyces albus]MDR7303755.1 DNA-binding LacI/PurR family transcriptional regulator [Haloactinomyces albus]